MRIWGTTEKEAAYALSACASAEEFLDAFIENKITGEVLRNLAVSLSEALGHTMGRFDERADELLETDWTNAVVDGNGRRYVGDI